MPQEKKPINQNLTVPNALSVLRIIIIPFFAWFFMHDQLAIAVALLVLSGLSDCVDGFIARKLNQVTELGKMLDPLADKLTQGVVARSLGREAKPTLTLDDPIPGRPPVMCAGCPHRGVFYTLSKNKCMVYGDIGCYTLGVMPPPVPDFMGLIWPVEKSMRSTAWR